MSLWQRLFRPQADERAALRPLWTRIVALAREPHWYAQRQVADSKAGRFDMLSLVTALVLVRLEREPTASGPIARLTELFIADLEGQLRQEGIGDPTVGKRIGELMGALGGRIGALREALATEDNAALVAAAARNATLVADDRPELLAEGLRALARRLDATEAARLLAGEVAP